jgi:2',3'-cyclic-nucleotide 2'-phosphodiesterase (5'-nucleotidase family)
MMRALNASVIVLLVAAAAAVPVRSRHSRSVRHGREAVAAATAARAGVASFEHDVNIVHLTDVHSWLSGHMHEPDDEADYPDVLAFFQHLKGMAHAQVRAAAAAEALSLPASSQGVCLSGDCATHL